MIRSAIALFSACIAGLLLACPTAPAAASDGAWTRLWPYQFSGTVRSVYDAAGRRMLLITQNAEVFEYALDTPSIRLVPVEGSQPPAMVRPAVAFDAIRRHVYVVGGTATYRLSLNGTPTWTQIAVTHLPSNLNGAVALVDPARDRLVVHGGDTLVGCHTIWASVWALDLTNPSSWNVLNPSGPGRTHHTVVLDAANDRFIVFGGLSPAGCEKYGDVWTFDLSSNLWSQMLVGGTPPAGRTLHTAALDETRNRMLVHGGGSPPELLALSLGATPTWSVVPQTGEIPTGLAGILDPIADTMVMVKTGAAASVQHMDLATHAWAAPTLPTEKPGFRANAVAVFDPVRNRMVLHGGELTVTLKDTWVRSLDASDSWVKLATSNDLVAGRSRHAAIYDPPRDRLLIFGGHNQTNDLWELPLGGPSALTWALVTPLGSPPPGRSGHTVIYDPEADRMITFGGLQYGYHDDTWSLALATSTWSQLFPGGAPPSRRSDHAAVYDPVRHRMIVLSGQLDGPTGPYTNEVWALDLTAMTWSQLTPAGSAPPGRADHLATYDRARDRIVIHGGRNSSSGPSLSDTWALSLGGTPTWTQLVPGGAPQPRSGAVGVFDALRDRMVLATGTNGSQHVDEIWQLAWTMPTSVEPAPRPPLAPGALRLSPNPSHAGVSIEFALATRGPARVGVVDLAGRRVAELREGEFDVGTHALRWDGRDAGGQRVAPGIYFVIVESGGERRTKRVVLMH